MSPLETATPKSVRVYSDIYTAILALAFLALMITTGMVCYYGYSFYGNIFAAN